MENIKVGDRVRSIRESAKVIAVEAARVQIRSNESGNREWVDAADFKAAFKVEQRRAA